MAFFYCAVSGHVWGKLFESRLRSEKNEINVEKKENERKLVKSQHTGE